MVGHRSQALGLFEIIESIGLFDKLIFTVLLFRKFDKQFTRFQNILKGNYELIFEWLCIIKWSTKIKVAKWNRFCVIYLFMQVFFSYPRLNIRTMKYQIISLISWTIFCCHQNANFSLSLLKLCYSGRTDRNIPTY